MDEMNNDQVAPEEVTEMPAEEATKDDPEMPAEETGEEAA